MLSYDTALNTTVYLQKERSYVAWRAVLINMQFLNAMFRHTSSYGAFKVQFIRNGKEREARHVVEDPFGIYGNRGIDGTIADPSRSRSAVV